MSRYSAANLTSLVSIFGGVANSTAGSALLGQLAVGNKTVFAPSNAAFANVSAAVASNTTLLAEILSYHILNGSYAVNTTAVSPAHTIAPTLLDFGGYNLPGNHSAPVVLSRANASSSSFFIAEAVDNVTTVGPVSVENLQVYIIDKVLTIPPMIGDAVAAIDPPLAALLNMTTFPYRLTRSPAFTIFAPSGPAVQAAASIVASLNSTLVFRVVDNHVINGSVVYSTELAQRNYTSQGGEPFVIMSNATGAYVTSGMTTAKIIQSDIILENGVVHVGLVVAFRFQIRLTNFDR